MTGKWIVQQVDIFYPSDNLKDKVYAIELLSLTYNNYNLQLSFSDNKGFSLLIFNNKKPEILEVGTVNAITYIYLYIIINIKKLKFNLFQRILYIIYE